MTLATHQIVVEADHQINSTGPIKESMGWWVERMCKTCVEPTSRRFFFSFSLALYSSNLSIWLFVLFFVFCFLFFVFRRLANKPEKTIVRTILIRHILTAWKHDIPSVGDYIPEKKTNKIQDSGDGTSQVWNFLFLFSHFPTFFKGSFFPSFLDLGQLTYSMRMNSIISKNSWWESRNCALRKR